MDIGQNGILSPLVEKAPDFLRPRLSALAGIAAPRRKQEIYFLSGRPSKYSDELAFQIAAAWLIQEWTLSGALKACGVSRSTGWRWRKEHSYFSALVDYVAKSRDPYEWEWKLPRQRKPNTFGPPKERKKLGRPTTYRPGAVRFFQASQRATARANGIPKTTLRNWCEAHPLEVKVPILIKQLEWTLGMFGLHA